MSDDLLARARAYAFEKWPLNHLVEGPWGETEWANSDDYGYDETARNAAILMAEWLLSQLPDREAVARQIVPSAWDDGQWLLWERDAQRNAQKRSLLQADAVLDLIRNGGAK